MFCSLPLLSGLPALRPGELRDLLLLLEVEEAEEVGDARVGGDVALAAQPAVRHLGLDRHDGELVLVHGLHGQVEPVDDLVLAHVEDQHGVVVDDGALLQLALGSNSIGILVLHDNVPFLEFYQI